MEISKPTTLLVILLLVASAATPFLFRSMPSDDRTIELSLSYKFRNSYYTYPSGWTSDEYTTEMTFSVNRINWTAALSDKSFEGYPLWLDVSSWYINENVYISTDLDSVVGDDRILNYDCWEVEINNETYAYYCKNTGLFVFAKYSHTQGTFFDTQTVTREYSLSSENLNDLFSSFVLIDGWLISGIFLQVAALIVIVKYSRSKSG